MKPDPRNHALAHLATSGLALVASAALLAGCGAARSAAGDTGSGSSTTPAAAGSTPTSGSSVTPTVDHRAHPGTPRGARTLPRLFPALPISTSGPDRDPVTLPDGTVAETFAEVRDSGSTHNRLRVTTTAGAILTAPVADGYPPALLRVPVRSGGERAYIVSQEGGDSDTWSVYVVEAGELVGVRRPRGSDFGAGFTGAGYHAVTSWQTRHGRGLYTRVGIEGDRYRVTEWTLHGARLVPTDLGIVCMHVTNTHSTYHAC